MERSFAHLLRTSRLATFDKSIPQIYTTTQTAKAIGDWGLKRNLPTVLKTHFVNIEDLDTAEHQTPFTSAASDYLFLQRWKENFPSSRPPAPQPLVVKKDLAAMTDADSQGAFGSTRSPGSTAYAASSTRPKVGPTYGFYVPTTPVIVQGRIFGRGRTTSSQYIGVCGVVATLPSAPAHLQNVSKSLQPYYVAKAEFGPDGRPDVVLSLTPPSPEPTNWSPGTIGSRSSTYVSSRLSQGAAAKEPLDANVKDKVISRVQVLLEERDKAATRQ
ncbi:hypothetical protein BGX31_009732 [Mortierella sp. GBA43]|nr:hypothetical protein BGX31_009732 [Mortierella sp. GBA43]